ncbi:uncharacterized protein At4g18490 isoform X2 [Benincasa hispida]|uniref:uncharacterized protein At4g18490 isoform X2 n=1 Tax=Benincasa hispida TaxID=102211 RepID=UPI0019019A56|nr:uncharacterized protein At4g18490 isoform X2 [Benincasa hispida]XP_038881420.1 uncharacterized protein At4g18490 isoform X2 [Benincasa hispida]
MAESKKGASSATDLTKKDSLLDVDIGDEFMNSWKSISVAEDDMVDFSFSTASKGKIKAFDFGTLDDDFNLDGSFKKLSSFKIDMPDLDFSSPPKKIEKARSSGKEGSSNENVQKDIDSLNFSFDFKELDSFDVDKSLQNGERTRKQQPDSKAVSSSRVEHEASDIHIAEGNTAIDKSIAKRLPAPENETTSRVENFQGDHGELESEIGDGTSHEARNTTATTNKERQFGNGCLSKKEVAKSSHQVIHDVPISCVARNVPECTSEPQSEICTERELIVVSGGTGNVIDENIDSDVTCSEKFPQSYLSPINIPASKSDPTEKEKSECSHLNEFVDNVQPAEVHPDLKDFSNSDVPRKLLLDTQEIRQNQNLKLKLFTVPLCRGPRVNEVTIKEKEMGGNSSMSRIDVSKPQLHQSSSISTKLLSLGKNRIDASNQILAAGDGNLCRESRPHNKVAKTALPVAVQSEKSLGKLSALSAGVNPSNLLVRTTTQTHCSTERLKLSMIPSQNVKTISAQGNKVCSIKTGLIFPNVSSLKTSRAFGGKQVLSSTGGVKERKLGEPEQTMEAGQRSKKLDIGYCAENVDKQKPLISNVKRKALEEPNADSMLLKPLKLLCVSPSGFRNSKEPLEKKIGEQVESMTTASHDQLANSIENPHVPNTVEWEISLVLENDRNVEKAEAYSQQLEDMCNMLRKKQDEAKEILVRAFVNNNNLLMLNHPIYEEKIMKVQKFAAKLLSKKLQTKAA